METPPRAKNCIRRNRKTPPHSPDIQGVITWNCDTPYRKTILATKQKPCSKSFAELDKYINDLKLQKNSKELKFSDESSSDDVRPQRRQLSCSRFQYQDSGIEQLLNILKKPSIPEPPKASSSPISKESGTSRKSEKKDDDDQSLWTEMDEDLLLHSTQLVQDIENNPEKYYKTSKTNQSAIQINHSTPINQVAKRSKTESNLCNKDISVPSASTSNASFDELLNDDSFDVLMSTMPDPQLMGEITPQKGNFKIQVTPNINQQKSLRRMPFKCKFNLDGPSPPKKRQSNSTNFEEEFFKDDGEWEKISPEMGRLMDLLESQNDKDTAPLCSAQEIEQKRKAALEKRRKKIMTKPRH